MSQRAIAERVNAAIGKNYSDASVGQWEKGEHVPEPEVVFAIEVACEVAAGDLSRHLGYLPLGGSTVLAAISVDPTLSPKQRNALSVMFRAVSSLDSSS